MERYDITIQMLGVEASGPQYVWEKVPAEEGELVLYTDAQATIAALQARVQELQNEIDTASDQIPPSMEGDSLSVALIKYRGQLTQRTAELEAANGSIEAARRVNNDLQAELERVRGGGGSGTRLLVKLINGEINGWSVALN